MSYVQIDFVGTVAELSQTYLSLIPCRREHIAPATGEPATAEVLEECDAAPNVTIFVARDGTTCFAYWMPNGDWYAYACIGEHPYRSMTVMLHE